MGMEKFSGEGLANPVKKNFSGLTLEEEMYARPCMVDDSRNSFKISIFTKRRFSVEETV